MEGVQAEEAMFKGADLTYADLSHAKIRDSSFSEANLFMTNLHEVDDEGTIWAGADKALAKGNDEKRSKSERWEA